MKTLVVIIMLLGTVLYGQTELRSNSGIGFNWGAKMNYGYWGIYYVYNLNAADKRFEVNGGIGIASSFVAGVGAKFRLYDNSTWFESFLALNYSYWAPGQVQYEKTEIFTDFYNISSLQFLHYSLANRFYLNNFVALQIDIGFSDNISGYSIVHTAGPNVSFRDAEKYAKSGILLGWDFIVFLVRKN